MSRNICFLKQLIRSNWLLTCNVVLLHAMFLVEKSCAKSKLVKAFFILQQLLSSKTIWDLQSIIYSFKNYSPTKQTLYCTQYLHFSLWIFSITVLVMWRDRKVSSTAFLLINLAITDTLTLLGFWFMQTLLLLDNNFESVNTGQWSNNRVIPEVDHSGNDARIVLEQNKLSKNSYL